MKTFLVTLLVFARWISSLYPVKLAFLDENTVLLNGKQRFIDVKSNIDFRKLPHSYLSSAQMRFDGSTNIEAVEKRFKYDDATSGTDMDLYETIFIKASKNKNGGQWMLNFDAKTNKLIQVVYSASSSKIVFYKQ